MNLDVALNNLSKDLSEVEAWAEGEYQKYFAQYFKGEVELYKKLKENDALIDDSQLEWILTYLPLELFSVSEKLSLLRTRQEVIKLHMKEVEDNVALDHPEMTATAKKERAAWLNSENKLLVDIYSSISDRVNREISFSRELIMSAKKIWDARRATEGPAVGGIKDSDKLPDYVPDSKTYIG